MPYAEINGFTSRAAAQRQYGRSKSSFIRDVDDAFSRGDNEFLKHFRVLLNDGTEIEGPEATKDALQIAQSKQPRWFIKTSLLEERYWEREDEAAAKATDADIHSDRVRRKSGRYDDEMLKADLQLAQQKIESQQMTIETLKGDKQFLQAELENRRGEIDKLRGFFESVGEAADSAARLKQGAPDHVADGNAIDGSVVSTDRDRKRTVAERYFPTVVGIWQRFRPTQ